MAKQIIVTKDNYGIELKIQFTDLSTKLPVDLTDKNVEVQFVDDTNQVYDILQATITDATNGKTSAILGTKHTNALGLHKTYWSVIDDCSYVTAQTDLFYYVKDRTGGANDDNYQAEINIEDVKDSLNSLDTRVTDIELQIEGIKHVNVNAEIIDARGSYPILGNRLNDYDIEINKAKGDYSSIDDRLNCINEEIDTKLNIEGGEIQGDLTSKKSYSLVNSIGDKSVITKEDETHNNVLSINADTSSISTKSKGSGIQLFGNSNATNSGNINFNTGENDKGKANMILDKSGKLTIGNGINSVVEEKQNPALLNIIEPNNTPAIYIQGASITEGELAVKSTQACRIGGYDEETGFQSWLETSNTAFKYKENNIAVQNINYKSGSVLITPVPNETVSVKITFETPFPTSPAVTVTPSTNAPGTSVIGCSVSGVTSSGFDIYFRRVSTTATRVYWIAMC